MAYQMMMIGTTEKNGTKLEKYRMKSIRVWRIMLFYIEAVLTVKRTNKVIKSKSE